MLATGPLVGKGIVAADCSANLSTPKGRAKFMAAQIGFL
jgi:hypothetical protein